MNRSLPQDHTFKSRLNWRLVLALLLNVFLWWVLITSAPTVFGSIRKYSWSPFQGGPWRPQVGPLGYVREGGS